MKDFDCGGEASVRRARKEVLNLLQTAPDPYDRTVYDPGHITASAVVWSPGMQQFLLVFHQRLGRWLQPGGHVEPGDVNPWHTAQRETMEETGVEAIPGNEPLLIGVDVHDIPPAKDEPAHQHFDLAFLFQAREPRMPSQGALHSAWCKIADFEKFELDLSIRRHIERATRHIGLSDAMIRRPRREGL